MKKSFFCLILAKKQKSTKKIKKNTILHTVNKSQKPIISACLIKKSYLYTVGSVF